MTDRIARRRRTNYLYLFKSEAVMHRALERCGMRHDTAAEFWAHTFKVPMFSDECPSTYAVYVSRVSYHDGFRPTKWWDIAAIGIWEVPDCEVADFKHTHVRTIKYVNDHPAIGGLSALALFGHVSYVADPDAKPYRGSMIDDRYEDRPDRPGISRFLKEHADHRVIKGDVYSQDLIEELMVLSTIHLPKEHLAALHDAEGATLTEVARYMHAIRFPAKKIMWSSGSYQRRFHPEWDSDWIRDAPERIEIDPTVSPVKVTEWAVEWKEKNHIGGEDHVLFKHIHNNDLRGLFEALDVPVLFVREDWIAPHIDMAYIVQEAMTGSWFMVYQTPKYDIGTVERKLCLPPGMYELHSNNVTIQVPKNCSVERCFDETDARYRLAKWYAAQLEAK